jgi:hypothetical protein
MEHDDRKPVYSPIEPYDEIGYYIKGLAYRMDDSFLGYVAGGWVNTMDPFKIVGLVEKPQPPRVKVDKKRQNPLSVLLNGIWSLIQSCLGIWLLMALCGSVLFMCFIMFGVTMWFLGIGG